MTNFTVRVTDSTSATADSAQTVNTTLGISGTLPAAEENVFYKYSLHVGGGVPPYAYSIQGRDVPGDPYFASVVALLHFDGTDASTTFTDVKGNSVTAFGGAQIDTAFSQFGGASGLFDGVDDYLLIDGPAFNPGTGDFTVEAWIRPGSVSGIQLFVSDQIDSPTSAAMQFRTVSGALQFVLRSTSGVNSGAVEGATLTAGVWYHVAATRQSGLCRMFVDGALVGTLTFADDVVASSPIVVGAGDGNTPGSTNRYNGHIDDLRITVGVARYTASFTPPTAAFPDVLGVTIPGSDLLPPGLSIDPQSGVIYGEPGLGSPAAIGSPNSFTFTVEVQDSQSPPQVATSTQTVEVVVPAPLPMFWDSAVAGSLIALEDDDTTARSTGAWKTVLGNIAHSTGKRQFECVVSTIGTGGARTFVGIGHIITGSTMLESFIGRGDSGAGSRSSIGYLSSGDVWDVLFGGIGGGAVHSTTGYANGDIITVGVDFPNSDVVFYKNGTLIYTKNGTETLPAYKPAMSSESNGRATLVGSGLTYPISGYTDWAAP